MTARRAKPERAGRYRLRITPGAARAREGLRGESDRRFEQLRTELKAQGCLAAGYRLLAADHGGWSEYCCVHLDRDWRVVLTFDTNGDGTIIEVARHDSARFYAQLAESYDVAKIGQSRDLKPACCSQAGWPEVGPTRAERKTARSIRRQA